MTVADLLTQLQAHDPHRLVVMRLAKGGCNCSPLKEVKPGDYLQALGSPWIGNAYPESADRPGAEAALVMLAEY